MRIGSRPFTDSWFRPDLFIPEAISRSVEAANIECGGFLPTRTAGNNHAVARFERAPGHTDSLQLETIVHLQLPALSFPVNPCIDGNEGMRIHEMKLADDSLNRDLPTRVVDAGEGMVGEEDCREPEFHSAHDNK